MNLNPCLRICIFIIMRNTINNLNALNIKMLIRKTNNFPTTAAAGAKRFLDQKITQKQGLLRNSNP